MMIQLSEDIWVNADLVVMVRPAPNRPDRIPGTLVNLTSGGGQVFVERTTTEVAQLVSAAQGRRQDAQQL